MSLFAIFLTFFKIGAFTIGGGYAMLPLIQDELCAKKGWLSNEDFLDAIALINLIPGAMVLNAGTFLGYRLKGVKGSIAAVSGSVLPSLIIITAVAQIFRLIIGNSYVAAFFLGVRPAVVVIMISAIVKLGKSARLEKIVSLLVLAVAFVLIAFLHVSSIWVVLGAAVFALLMDGFGAGKEASDE